MDSLLSLLVQLLQLAGSLLLIALAGLLLWAAASPFAYALLKVAEKLRLPEAYRWVLTTLRSLNPVNAWAAAYGTIPPLASVGPEAKVILDERLATMREFIRRTVDAVKGASGSLLALGGARGPGAVAQDVRALQDRVEELAELGGDIPEDIVGDYQVRAKSIAAIILFGTLLLAISIVNGYLLSMFFKDLVFGYFAGIRTSYIVAMLLIITEAGVGALAYHYRSNATAKALYFAGILVLACSEAVIFGLMSYGFELDVPFMDDNPVLRFWLAPLGLILVTATGGIGYGLHGAIDEIFERVGAKRLKREIRTLNSLLRSLPDHWEGIRSKADAAAASIAGFQSALGGQESGLAGAVEKIAAERAAMEHSLVNARVDSWPQAVDGQVGDSARKRMQQVGIAIITLVAVGLFAAAMQAVLGRAFRTWDGVVVLPAALMTASAFYVIGWLSFERIQLLGERVFPLRAGTRETAVAVIAGLAATLAIMVASWRVGGTSGLAYAMLLIAGGGVLAVLGYFLDDTIRGVSILGRLIVAVTLGLAAFIAAALAHALGWPLLGVFGAVWLLLSLVAWPLDRLVSFRLRSPPQDESSASRRRGKLKSVA